MHDHRTDPESIVHDLVGHGELEAAFARAGTEPAQSTSASAAPLPGRIVQNDSYNRYLVQLTAVNSTGEPQSVPDEQLFAINLGEPFDQPGALQPDADLLVWPSQGLYLFCQPPPAQPAQDYWARVLSGSGPDYIVRRQTASSDRAFVDAAGATEAVVRNLWELTVDGAATADVPIDAIVRVFEEPDVGGTARRFFFYPIHAVYR